MTTLVLTAIGNDRAGLVEALADVITSHGGNWESSRMAEMAGKFAGIVMVTVSADKVDDLVEALGPLEAQGLLDVTVEKAIAAPPVATPDRLTVHVVGLDQPGIVRDLSGALAARGMSIEELETSTSNAPMAGGTLFQASMTLAVPAGTDADGLEDALDALAEELSIDIDITED